MSFRLYAGLVLFTFLLGCASTTDFDAVKNDINQLRKDTFELQKDGSDFKKDLGDIRLQIAGTVKDDSFNAIRESQAALYSQVADLSKEFHVLSGRFDEGRFFIEKSLKDSSAEKELLRYQLNNLEAQVRELNEKLVKLSAPALTPASSAAGNQDNKESEALKKETIPAAKAAADLLEEDPLKAYDTAYSLFKDKKYRAARERFAAFIPRFPKDSRAGNAQFWIAEAYYAEKDFESAILAYETLIKSHPRSEKVPAALLKQGLSFLEIDDKKTAKVIFDRLIEQYPDSKEAETARKKRTEITKKPVKAKTR